MSIQNNLNIIVNPQISNELQSSGQINSVNSKPSYNFEELLASYQKENQTEKPKEVSSENKVENYSETKEDKVEKTEKKSEVAEEKKVESPKEEKSAEKTDSRGEKSVAKVDESSEEVKGKSSKKEEKKITEKDFAQINQIVENSEKNAVEITVVQNNEQVEKLAEIKNSNDEKLQKTELSSENLVLEASGLEESNFAQQLAAATDNSEGENEFNFANDQTQSEKKFSLDKDGKITVQDERTKLSVESEKVEKNSVKAKTDIKITGDNTATITMEMAETAQENALSMSTQTAASSTSDYQAMFSNQLQNAAPDFVKAGQIILKDNNQGTINLVLHPDDLGNVKIHLSLDGKTVSAQITVATKEAMEVFKDNAETLREAFIKQGFENASFDVSYGNNSNGFAQNSDFEQNDGREMLAMKTYNDYASPEDSSFEEVFENNSIIGNYSVNIVA